MSPNISKPKYKRILLKLSGESLQGDKNFGIDAQVLDRMALEIGQLVGIGVQIGMVIGGGNLFRGTELSAVGLDRITGDHMGMLATVMNALAMRDALERANINTLAMSSIPMSGVVETYDRRRALRFVQENCVVIFCAGTGNPFFTTDSAACLRGIEINADIVLKATKVDGIFNKDPVKYKDAKKIPYLTYDQVLTQNLRVMDMTAICMLRDQGMPLRVFDVNKPGALLNTVVGKEEGSFVGYHNE